MKTTIYENKDFILIRKPHGIPSTFGKLESFLDKIKNNESEHNFTWTPLSELVPEDIFSFMSSRLGDFQPAEDPEVQLRHQVDTFGEDQEFGLLNRLDNETGEVIPSKRTAGTAKRAASASEVTARALVAGPYLLLEKLTEQTPEEFLELIQMCL